MECVEFSNTYNNIKDHLVHKREMKFLDGSCEVDASRNHAMIKTLVAQNQNYLDAHGFVYDFWLVEFMAQSVAVLFDIKSEAEKCEVGYLVCIDKVSFLSKNKVSVGDELIIKVKMDYDVYPFGVYRTSLELNNKVICEAKMKFMIDKEGVVKSKMYS